MMLTNGTQEVVLSVLPPHHHHDLVLLLLTIMLDSTQMNHQSSFLTPKKYLIIKMPCLQSKKEERLRERGSDS